MKGVAIEGDLFLRARYQGEANIVRVRVRMRCFEVRVRARCVVVRLRLIGPPTYRHHPRRSQCLEPPSAPSGSLWPDKGQS